MGAVWPLLARDVLAIAFILTATWKAIHRQEYIVSFRRLRPDFIRSLEPVARSALVLAEITCAALLIASPAISGAAQLAGPLLAVVLLVMFTSAIAAQPSLSDCGCWSSPANGPAGLDLKGSLLARNGVLLAVSLAAFIPVRSAASAVVFLSSLASAVVLAPIILELPQVISVARFHSGSQIGGASS